LAPHPLSRAAPGAAILALGVVAEATAPAATPVLTAVDFTVGALLGCGGAWLLGRAPAAGRLGLLTAAAWFAGSLAPALVLLYRGGLLHLLLIAGGTRRDRLLPAAGWIAALLPIAVGGPATAALALIVAAVAAARAGSAAAGRRQALVATSIAAAALSGVWWLAVLNSESRTALALLNAAAVVAASAIALSAGAGMWTRRAAARVIDLGAGPGRPVAAQLARALADPALQVRYGVPGIGWVDERGLPVPAPDGSGAITRAAVPGGGEVALLHGTAGPGDPRLAEAAAAAAALALDSARLEAAVQTQAADVRASRRRLLTVGDAERQALERRLSEGPLARLRRVDRLLGDQTAGLREELHAAIAELADLGRGLYPPELARADLVKALEQMAGRSPLPTSVEITGDPQQLSDELRATTWFICSEALANVGRHSAATQATITIRIDPAALVVEVRDNGRGGATATRGLRGLADRVAAGGGAFTLSSPTGGPTVVRAHLPLQIAVG
jgi:signal transduction histidine kinase